MSTTERDFIGKCILRVKTGETGNTEMWFSWTSVFLNRAWLICMFNLCVKYHNKKCQNLHWIFAYHSSMYGYQWRIPLRIKYRVSQKKVGSQKISNCFNSLNFEAKIDCNIIKPNVAKWRKTCTGLKFDLLNFYGPQSNIHTFWDPSFFWLTL